MFVQRNNSGAVAVLFPVECSSLRFCCTQRTAGDAVQKSTYTTRVINPYPTAFPYGNGMVLHFYQQQESSTTKTVHRVINKGLKTYV